MLRLCEMFPFNSHVQSFKSMIRPPKESSIPRLRMRPAFILRLLYPLAGVVFTLIIWSLESRL
ncbi:hypothetical protein EVA_09678 [gut metagenome]|uniref:Uncharacterized protein n=1 Tax=gut metagenome TaxID=749906 RepID=J9CQ09_9ZZZZ